MYQPFPKTIYTYSAKTAALKAAYQPANLMFILLHDLRQGRERIKCEKLTVKGSDKRI